MKPLLDLLATDGMLTGLLCAAKAGAVLAGAGLVALALRRRAAATRHLVWALGLGGALAVLPLALAAAALGSARAWRRRSGPSRQWRRALYRRGNLRRGRQ